MKQSLFDFEIFARPELEELQPRMKGQPKARLLVVAAGTKEREEADQAFLAKVLAAVELAPLEEKVYLLPVRASEKIPLSDLARSLAVDHILLFGTEPQLLGIRAQLPLYQFVKLGELTVFLSHSLQDIEAERQAGKKEKAAALWRALKAKFL